MAPQYRHIFFDATDTLLRVRGSVGAVYAPVAARHGLALTSRAIDAAFQPAMAAAPPPAFPGATPEALPCLERDWWHAVVQRALVPLGPFPGFEAFFAEVFAIFRTPEPWELLPGARAALETLRTQGRRLGLISDMDSRLLDVLAALELDHLLETVVLSPSAGFAKPDPRLFTLALERAGATAASSAHVGDSLRADIAGARAAGMLAIYFDSRGRGDAPAEVPAVRQLADLPALLERLERTPARDQPPDSRRLGSRTQRDRPG